MGLVWRAPRATLLGFVPAVLVVAAAAIGTNMVAHGHWKTPYAHRQDGPVLTSVGGELAASLDAGRVPSNLVHSLEAVGLHLSDQASIEQRRPGERWSLWDPASSLRLALVNADEPPNHTIEVRRWDNWYDYPGSYWRPENLRGIDRGESSPWTYALHVLIGHHGLFSLTPIWLLSVAGCYRWLRPRGRDHLLLSNEQAPSAGEPAQPAWLDVRFVLAATTLIITVVVVGFYLSRPQIDRNYGGGTSCLRWLLWLAPLWLLTLLPAVDRLSRSWWGRGLMLVLLGISVFSAHYAADNPWSHPWLYDYWAWLGWIES
jgi:hypothetical protein